jgi:hypothetical protein
VYCYVDMLVVDVLDERVASSEYRYSAGNVMGIVVVVDRKEAECCATARSATKVFCLKFRNACKKVRKYSPRVIYKNLTLYI